MASPAAGATALSVVSVVTSEEERASVPDRSPAPEEPTSQSTAPTLALMDPSTTAESHFARGKLLLEQQRTDEALQAFMQVLSINPNHPEARQQLFNSLKENMPKQSTQSA
jgi:hypothetical protein